MEQPEWITRTRRLLNLPQPPWFARPPRRFDQTERDQIRFWFRRIPDTGVAIFVGGCIARHSATSDSIRLDVATGFRAAILGELETLHELCRKYESSQSTLPRRDVCYPLFEGLLGSSPSIAFELAFQKLIEGEFEFRTLAHQVFSDSPTSWELDASHANQLWNSQSQHEAFAALQSVFLPPESFQPTTPAEWLIAADMLEEAGEVRAEAIRAAVNGASEEELFAATYKALPPDWLL